MSKALREEVVETLQILSHELRGFNGGVVERLDYSSLTSLSFLRDYVCTSKPVVLKGAIDHWPALQRWSNEQLKAVAGHAQVTVALTPTGRADAVTPLPPPQSGECFALPAQRSMQLADFILLLESSGRGSVTPYLQFQNSSLTTELPQLLGDVQDHLPWATEAFGSLPDAINVWMGDERSVTSMHKDHYENIFCVIRGAKTFTLLPPGDIWRMRLRQYSLASYQPTSPGAYLDTVALEDLCHLQLAPVLHDPPEAVVWSAVQPGEHEQLARTEDPTLPPPLSVTVQAGEVLYLPAMWWHQVEQQADASGLCVAVNYWYDMQFGAAFANTQAINRLAVAVGLNEGGEAVTE